MSEEVDDSAVVVLTGSSTPQGIELLRLEIRRVAEKHGAELVGFRVERADEIDLLT